MLEAIHMMHLVAAVIWGGGSLYQAFVFYPGLARCAAPQAEAAFLQSGRYSRPVLGVAGALVMVTGPARAWAGGGVRDWSDLWQPYGLAVVAAFLLAFWVPAMDGILRARYRRMFSDAALWQARAMPLARLNAWITGVGYIALLMIMGAMGLGMV